MAMISGHFDSEIIGYDAEGMPIFDRACSSEVFAKFLSYLFGNGILNYMESCFKVVQYEGMKVKVKPGFAIAQGFFGYDESDTEITLDDASTTYARKDRIVFRLDKVGRLTEIIKKTGTPANTPVAPDIVQSASGDYFELGLAVIDVAANQTTITSANITDTRYDSSVCGISEPLIGTIDTSAIFAQLNQMLVEYQGDFEAWMAGEEAEIIAWFNEIKDQISGDVAVNLQLQITALLEEMENVVPFDNIIPVSEAGAITQRGKYVGDAMDVYTAYNQSTFIYTHTYTTETVTNEDETTTDVITHYLEGSGANGKFKSAYSGTVDEFVIGDTTYTISHGGTDSVTLVEGNTYDFMIDGTVINFSNPSAIDMKIEDGKPMWKEVGADTWDFFSSDIELVKNGGAVQGTTEAFTYSITGLEIGKKYILAQSIDATGSGNGINSVSNTSEFEEISDTHINYNYANRYIRLTIASFIPTSTTVTVSAWSGSNRAYIYAYSLLG